MFIHYFLVQNGKYYLCIRIVLHWINFLCTGDRTGTDKLCGREHDGSLQTTCGSYISR